MIEEYNEEAFIDAEQFKIVTIEFDETAQIVVRASSDEEATEAVMSSFPNVPNLHIISIEDAPSDVVAEVKSQRQSQQKVLN